MAKVKTFRKRNRKNKTFRKRNRNRSKNKLYGGRSRKRRANKQFSKRNRKNKTFRKRNRNRSKKILYGGLLSRGAGVICQVYSTTGIDEDERATAVVLESTEDGKVTVKMDDGRIKTYPHEDLILPNISALPADLRWAVQQQENAPLTSEQRVQLGLRFPEDTISAGGERNFSSKHFLPTTEHK